MPIPTVGGVKLDDGGNLVTFNTDPDPYEHQSWQKRHSVHKTIGGGQVIQDFGVFATDNIVTLASGDGQFIDEVVRAALNTRWMTKGATYRFRDYLGNDFTVFIQEFQPTIFRMGGGVALAATQLYHYKMKLQVVAIAKLYGATYSGS
jgi:hypothetical protein